MAKHVLVPVDQSEQSENACRFVVEEFPDAEVVLLHVIDPSEGGYTAGAGIPSSAEKWYERTKEDAERRLAELSEEVLNHGDVSTTVEVGRPSRTIIDYAEDHEVDHIVMGSHGREGVTRILLGSVAETVVRKASVPVTVAR